MDGTIVLDIAIPAARIAADATHKRINMKTLRLSLLFLASSILSSVPVWADGISTPPTEYDFTAWASFTAPVSSGCLSNCTETIGESFLFTAPPFTRANNWPFVVPVEGTFSVSSSGFLGTFSTNPEVDVYYENFMNPLGSGDQIDMGWASPQGPEGSTGLAAETGMIPLGTNTVNFYLYSCVTQACQAAYGNSWETPTPGALVLQTAGGSSVTAVPDGDSSLLLMLSALVPIGAAYRWRSQGQQA
jgi:hypothetical protein